MNNRLFRSESNRVLAGVCGGLGAYFGVDPIWPRLLFVMLALAGAGVGLLLYLVLWVILPLEGQAGATPEIGQQVRSMGDDVRAAFQGARPQRGLIAGLALIGLGFWFLLDQMHLTHLFWLRPSIFWPLVLIAVGAMLLLRRTSSNPT